MISVELMFSSRRMLMDMLKAFSKMAKQLLRRRIPS